jgi:hypothetical protein
MMNPVEEARALRAFLESRGFNPSGRAVIATLRSFGLKFRDADVRDAAGVLAGRKIPSRGTHSAQTRDASTRERADHKGVVIDSLRDHDSKSTPPPPSQQKPDIAPAAPALFVVETETVTVTVKKPKPTRVISAYAGTTIESFGELAPLVTEILACDGFATTTKAFARALETLAMWRATYGEAAFVHGLQVTVDKRFGHRYVGGVARNYDPERERPRLRAFDGSQNESDKLPTRIELEESGAIAAEPERPLARWETPPWKQATG